MPKIVVPLTDTRIRTVKAADKPIKLSDGGGMYLLVDPQGNKTWRLDYTRPIIKKRNTITLGSYPQLSLAEARQQRDRIKKDLSEGIDPSTEKKRIAKENLEEHLNTFHAIAEDWLSRQNYSEATLEKANRLLKYAYMGIGNKPISAITPRDILAVCRQLEEKAM